MGFALDSIMLESSSRYQIFSNGDLVISNVNEADSGSYKCVRSNEAGSVSGEAFLGVLGKSLTYLLFSIHNKYLILLFFFSQSSNAHYKATYGHNSSFGTNRQFAMQSF